MKWISGFALIVLAVLSIFLNQSTAQGALPTEKISNRDFLQRVPELKQKCYQTAKSKWDTGVTSTMVEGNAEYDDCLNDLATELAERFYPKDAFDKEGFRKELDNAVDAIGTVQFNIYNNDQFCGGWCGTHYKVFPFERINQYLENLIFDMASYIDEKKFGEENLSIVDDAWIKAYRANESTPQ